MPAHVFTMWMHVTHGDRVPPNSIVLAKMPDLRVEQWWDPMRLVSKTMLRQYPPDTVMAMADTTGGQPPLVWDLVAIWKPGTVWGDRMPVPDFAVHPIAMWMTAFRQKLGELSRAKS